MGTETPCQVESEAMQSQPTREYKGIRFKVHNQKTASDLKQRRWWQLHKRLEACAGIRIARLHQLTALAQGNK